MNNKAKSKLVCEVLGITRPPRLQHYTLREISIYKWKWRKKGHGRNKIGKVYRAKLADILSNYSVEFLDTYAQANHLALSDISTVLKYDSKAIYQAYQTISNGVILSDYDESIVEAEEKTKPALCLLFNLSYLILTNYLSFLGAYKNAVAEKGSDLKLLNLKANAIYRELMDYKFPQKPLSYEEKKQILKDSLEGENAIGSQLYPMPLYRELTDDVEYKAIPLFSLKEQAERISNLLRLPIFKNFQRSYILHEDVKDLIVMCSKAIEGVKNLEKN